MSTQGISGGILVGVGAGLAIVVLLVVQAASSGGAFGTRTETVTQTSTVTATQNAIDMVNGSFAEHMLLLGSGNVSAIVGLYEGNATVTWMGAAYGLGTRNLIRGTYVGTENITRLLEAGLFELNPSGTAANSSMVGNVTRAITVTSDDSVAVNSTFGFVGQDAVVGNFRGTVSAQDSYSYSATRGAWLISLETWNFLSYIVEYPVTG